VTPCIEGLLEIAHVGILFGVNARIRKQHRKITIGDKESQLRQGRSRDKSILNEELHLGWAPMQSAERETKRRARALIFRAPTLFLFGTAMTPAHVTAIIVPRICWRSGGLAASHTIEDDFSVQIT
jgi:hypothetical protein